jgi:hypothetical protein
MAHFFDKASRGSRDLKLKQLIVGSRSNQLQDKEIMMSLKHKKPIERKMTLFISLKIAR